VRRPPHVSSEREPIERFFEGGERLDGLAAAARRNREELGVAEALF
jgi:hypothetical protein